MATAETTIVDAWLDQVLGSDTTLAGLATGGCWDTLADESAAFPYVVWQLQAGRDVGGIGPATRIMVNGLWLVRGVDRSPSQTAVKPIAERVDALLHAASGSVTGGLVVACVREEPYKFLEVTDGVMYWHLGGMYRIWAQAT